MDVFDEFLAKRKNRSMAIILGVKERECDQYLPPQASDALRKVVLDQMNAFYETCLDMLNTLDTGEVVVNTEYLERVEHKLDQVLVATKNGNGHGN